MSAICTLSLPAYPVRPACFKMLVFGIPMTQNFLTYGSYSLKDEPQCNKIGPLWLRLDEGFIRHTGKVIKLINRHVVFRCHGLIQRSQRLVFYFNIVYFYVFHQNKQPRTQSDHQYIRPRVRKSTFLSSGSICDTFQAVFKVLGKDPRAQRCSVLIGGFFF